jgi:ATP-dependent RNA helicase RhlE
LKAAVELLTGPANFDVFKTSDKVRVLIIANENSEAIDLHGIPFLIHFELPADKETYINRVTNDTPGSTEETLAITFTTDLELVMVKKIEQAIGQKILVAELPEELVIEKDRQLIETTEKKKVAEPVIGQAFHEKKASNLKTHNYSAGLKAKMNNKKKHS